MKLIWIMMAMLTAGKIECRRPTQGLLKWQPRKVLEGKHTTTGELKGEIFGQVIEFSDGISLPEAKIQSYWENQIYKVVERKAEDSPVYRLCPETGQGRDKVVHRNLLLPCDFLPLEKPPAKTVHPQKGSPTVTRKNLRHPRTQQQPGNGDTSDDEYSSTYQWHLKPVPGRQQRQTPLDPLAEPLQPEARPHVQEEDLPLQSEEDEIQGYDVDLERSESGEVVMDILAANEGETETATPKTKTETGCTEL